MSKRKLALGVLLALVLAYIAAAPYITVYRMKAAAQAHDGQVLASYIELPSVRQSLKDQINVRLTREFAPGAEVGNGPLAVLGAAFAGMVIDKVVDMYVTPEGITQLMAGDTLGGVAPQRDAESQSDDSAATAEPLRDVAMGYTSLNRFTVVMDDRNGDQEQFVLRRRGLGWKLTEILLPTGYTPPTPADITRFR